jgi:hypothetical protein
MEHAFGADFGGVRIHAASPLPAQVAAEAFTLGSRIHFAPGRYDPASRAAQRLLAHDLLIRDSDAKAAGHIVTTKAIAGTAGFTNKMKDGMIYGAWNAATTAPQVTMGVRVSSIPDIVKDLHGSPNESAGKATSRAPGRLKMRDAKATDATKPKKLQAGNESKTLVDGHQLAKQAIVNSQAIDHAAPGGKELEGFLTIIFTYVEGTRNKRSFLKSHTPLMAKTDLATVWGTLPGPVQAYYGAVNAAGMTAFERLVRAAPGYNNRLGQPLFVIPAATKGSIVENNKATNQRQWYEKLTLSSWLRGIAIDRTRTPTQAIQDCFLNTPIGVDQLSDKHFPSKPRDQEVEGYAALGSRMDATGAAPLPVFELRSATKQIRFSEASQWALKLFDYVRPLNANPGGGHTRIT